VAALSSAAGFDYFLTEPYNTLSISDRADIETADAEHGAKALLADGGADRAHGCADDAFDLG
jgi:hypothetical protein